jgi:flagellar motor protein MotB
MTATFMMMAMLATGCVPKAKYDQLQQQHRKLKREVRAIGEARQATLDELKESLSGAIERGVIDVTVDDRGRVVIGMSSDVLFTSGSAELSDRGRTELAKVGRILSRRTESTFQVEGHTDSEPIATAQYPNNWYLGAARAIVVTEKLIAAGMSPQNLSAASYADTHPANVSYSNQNRRIELVFIPDLSAFPGFEADNDE